MTTTKAAGRTERPAQEGEKKGRSLPHVPVPRVEMPSGTTGQVLWWGGLAAVAALGVVEWPVAAVVGAGTWVAEQYAKQLRQANGGKHSPRSG